MKKDPTLISVLLALLVLSALFFVIERLIGSGRRQPVVRKGWWTDVVYWFITPFVTKQLVAWAIILPAALLVFAKVATVEALLLGNCF